VSTTQKKIDEHYKKKFFQTIFLFGNVIVPGEKEKNSEKKTIMFNLVRYHMVWKIIF